MPARRAAGVPGPAAFAAVRRRAGATALLTVLCTGAAVARTGIEELKARTVLDDYESNIVHGYNIVMDTPRYAPRYAGNRLSCTNCHLKAGTVPDALPLNVAGLYPRWRAKNGVRNGIGLRIRECFVYSHNGVMPPADAPEVLAVAAYIHWLSEGEVIGTPPRNWGVPTLTQTNQDPNPAMGETVYRRACLACHGAEGQGGPGVPPLWGPDAYNAGAGMNNIHKAAGFIWANMPLGAGRSLSQQEALDVAAYLHLQPRPFDPREGRLRKLGERLLHWLGGLGGSEGR